MSSTQTPEKFSESSMKFIMWYGHSLDRERDLWAISKRPYHTPYHTLTQINSHPTVKVGNKWQMCYRAGTRDFAQMVMCIWKVSWKYTWEIPNIPKPSFFPNLLKVFFTNYFFTNLLINDHEKVVFKQLVFIPEHSKRWRTRNKGRQDGLDKCLDKKVSHCRKNRFKVMKQRGWKKLAIHGDGPRGL